MHEVRAHTTAVPYAELVIASREPWSAGASRLRAYALRVQRCGDQNPNAHSAFASHGHKLIGFAKGTRADPSRGRDLSKLAAIGSVE
jgi:hypothetical protein